MNENQKLKNSGLSVAALVLSIMGCTFIVGIILAIIDLAKKDDTKKHGLSIAAIIISAVWIIIALISGGGDTPKTEVSSLPVKSETSAVSDTDTAQNVVPTVENSEEDSLPTIIEEENISQEVPEKEPVESSGTVGQKNALSSAKSYLDYSAFSYEGLIEQLEYEKFSPEDAAYAADNCGADWNEQAVASAKSYLNYSAFSYKGLIGQLEYDKFTTEQATYGADNCNADWNEQAAASGKTYLDYSSFSRDSLIEQLEYDGFTSEQAIYGVESNGY